MSVPVPNTQDLARVGVGRRMSGEHRELGPIGIDSRNIAKDGVFFAIAGPRFDGHDYLKAAADAGARVVVARADSLRLRALLPTFEAMGVTAIGVTDPQHALSMLAALHRARFRGPVVGLTGSSGKTTTKELTAAVLRAAGPTLATQGNLNNHLGVPLTLLRIDSTHRFAVIEMGMSALGEIAWLARLARPSLGVITTVGPAHIEQLGSLDNIARAKGELFRALPESGQAFLPSNCDRPWIVSRGLKTGLTVVGERNEDDLRALAIRETVAGLRATIVAGDERNELKLNGFSGRYQIHNALLALAVGRRLGVSVADGCAALAQVSPPSMRGEVRRLADGTRVVLDCYNANPQSMAAAAAAFLTTSPEGVLVLGDMLELGPEGPALHAQVGAGLAGQGQPALIVAVGPLAAHLAQGAVAAGVPADRVHTVADAAAAAVLLRDARPAGAAILLKASRGVRLERVYTDLAAEQTPSDSSRAAQGRA
jgi:UDP-N-acetylmuramoyl-tripeptide--D-alanyl-D-alanine ligase